MSAVAIAPLGDLCVVTPGGTPSRSNPSYWGGVIPWVKISDMLQGQISHTEEHISQQGLENSAAKVLPKGTLLLSIFATIGRTAVLDIDAATNQAIVGLSIRDRRLNQQYLKHFLEFKTPLLQSQARGVAQANINGAILKGLPIPLPSLCQQQRITAILDHADALRARRRAALAQLDMVTQAIFLEMFGATSETIHCPLTTLGEVADVLTGYPFRSNEYTQSHDSVRLCRGANVLPGRVDWSDLASWPSQKTEQFAEFILSSGDVVIAMDRPWISEGFKVARIGAEDCPALLVQRVARLRSGPSATNGFLYHLLKQPAFSLHCRPTETLIPHISPLEIRSFTFRLPPIAMQQRFEDCLSGIAAVHREQNACADRLKELFNTLQHRAFRGEL